MIRKFTIALAGATAATVLLLTGCGGTSQAGTGDPATQPSNPAGAPSSPTSGASTPTGGEASEDPGSGQDAGGKPSKQEIITGLTNFYQETQGQPADKAKKFATCMVDEMYDKAKPATLRAMRDGTPTKIDKGDQALIANAGYACQKHIS